MNYYEIDFGEHYDNVDNARICIKGTRQPTVKEANKFCAKDVERIGYAVIGVYPIDEETARACYDFTNEAEWPVFGA